MRKLLTNNINSGYTESLKTSIHGFRTRQICDFFVRPYGWMRAENIQYQPKLLYTAFSESTLPQIARGLLKRIYKMTNTIISHLLETRNLLDIVYSNTESDNLALRCSVVRRELANIVAEMLVTSEAFVDTDGIELLAAE